MIVEALLVIEQEGLGNEEVVVRQVFRRHHDLQILKVLMEQGDNTPVEGLIVVFRLDPDVDSLVLQLRHGAALDHGVQGQR